MTNGRGQERKYLQIVASVLLVARLMVVTTRMPAM